jgi:hypothetical protein
LIVETPASQPALHCPINLFPVQEVEVARLTQTINRTRTAAEKVTWAQALMNAVDVMLGCQAYDEQSPDCRLCRQFARVRRKTAQVVVLAGEIGARRS